jgi:flagellar biosynthesis protein FlhA
VGSGELVMNHLLAIGPLSELEHLPGKLVKDPTYNMEGKWIPASEKVKSQTFGCMVFDCVSVVATQLTEMVRIHAGELYTLEAAACHLKDPDVQYVAKTLVPARLELVQVWQILRNLMEERIAIRDRLTILQSLLEFTAETRDVDELTERVRGAILGDVLHAIDPDEPPVIQAWFLPPEHEQMLRQGRAGGVSAVGLGIVAAAHAMKEAGLTPVVVVAADLRRQLVKMLDTIWPTTSPATRRIWVLSRTETVFRGQKVTRFLSKTTSTG